jgi:hypothetical protein
MNSFFNLAQLAGIASENRNCAIGSVAADGKQCPNFSRVVRGKNLERSGVLISRGFPPGYPKKDSKSDTEAHQTLSSLGYTGCTFT